MQEMAARDHQDETREAAPLRVPAGAIVIDTTDLTVDEVVVRCLAVIKGRVKRGRGEKVIEPKTL